MKCESPNCVITYKLLEKTDHLSFNLIENNNFFLGCSWSLVLPDDAYYDWSTIEVKMNDDLKISIKIWPSALLGPERADRKYLFIHIDFFFLDFI